MYGGYTFQVSYEFLALLQIAAHDKEILLYLQREPWAVGIYSGMFLYSLTNHRQYFI